MKEFYKKKLKEYTDKLKKLKRKKTKDNIKIDTEINECQRKILYYEELLDK